MDTLVIRMVFAVAGLLVTTSIAYFVVVLVAPPRWEQCFAARRAGWHWAVLSGVSTLCVFASMLSLLLTQR